MKIENGFNTKWNVSHCIGAWDGKHIALQSPMNSGPEYYNYKHIFSIVLMAAVDSNYNVIWASVGAQGRRSDGGMFDNTTFKTIMTAGQLNLQEPSPLPGRELSVPYVFLADDAFPLSFNIIKPFAGYQDKGTKEKICHYGFIRRRRVVENCFVLLASVFRVFRKPMLLEPNKAEIITMVYLHNYLSSSSNTTYCPMELLIIKY